MRQFHSNSINTKAISKSVSALVISATAPMRSPFKPPKLSILTFMTYALTKSPTTENGLWVIKSYREDED